MFKLPAAFFCGVRLKFMRGSTCVTTVKHRWINQNPFKSLFWAVQGMAAELSTGAMVMREIQLQKEPISMLVISNKGAFFKKGRGRINFTCNDGTVITEAIAKTLATGEGQTFWMHSKGVDASGDEVSTFSFEWTIRVKRS